MSLCSQTVQLDFVLLELWHSSEIWPPNSSNVTGTGQHRIALCMVRLARPPGPICVHIAATSAHLENVSTPDAYIAATCNWSSVLRFVFVVLVLELAAAVHVGVHNPNVFRLVGGLIEGIATCKPFACLNDGDALLFAKGMLDKRVACCGWCIQRQGPCWWRDCWARDRFEP